ncbi:hypothetical protein Syun_000486 [Stephania yunnanensis]|uniref:Uncharacterized protein n=1 Tax=Stephania yunnanensis TaxID=152371 RepID=A0AAP0LCB4_9MAGN
MTIPTSSLNVAQKSGGRNSGGGGGIGWMKNDGETVVVVGMVYRDNGEVNLVNCDSEGTVGARTVAASIAAFTAASTATSTVASNASTVVSTAALHCLLPLVPPPPPPRTSHASIATSPTTTSQEKPSGLPPLSAEDWSLESPKPSPLFAICRRLDSGESDEMELSVHFKKASRTKGCYVTEQRKKLELGMEMKPFLLGLLMRNTVEVMKPTEEWNPIPYIKED